MVIRILLLALVAGIVYLNYTNPSEHDHQEAILAQLEQSWPIPEDMQAALWHDVDYSNFLVCSFMKTREDSKMISTGYRNQVKVVNDKWLAEARQNLQSRLAY